MTHLQSFRLRLLGTLLALVTTATSSRTLSSSARPFVPGASVGGRSTEYKVLVTDRSLTGKPLISNASSADPFSRTACGGNACTNVLNPAWIPFEATSGGSGPEDGGLFVRLATPGCYPNVIALVPALPASRGLAYPRVSDEHVLRDGPPTWRVANGDDPRAVYRPLTGEYFVTYQLAPGGNTRRTFISSTRTPSQLASWRRFPASMLPFDDCGTSLWFPDDAKPHPPGQVPKAYAVATYGELRGGNLTLISSSDGLHTWREEAVLLRTRPGHWDNATLSAGPPPVLLEDGNWLLLYNVDNLWPVHDPRPLPAYGRCALGWAILDGGDVRRVLARAAEPLVTAQLPWELRGTTAKVVYTDGIRSEGNNTFTVFAGGADTVVEAFRIHVAGNQVIRAPHIQVADA